MNSPLTLQSLLSHFLDPVGRMLDKAQSRTKGCWPWIVVCVAVALAFVLRMPPYHEMAAFPSTPYGKALTWWLDHPFSSIPVDDFFPLSTRHVNNNAGCASHCDKIAVRVTLPLLNQLFHGGIWTLVAASNLAAVLIFYLVYRLVIRDTKDGVTACFATWALACSNTGRVGFQDYIFGDSVALALLMGALLATRPWLIGALVFTAGFTDERALIASPLVALYHAWRDSSLSGKNHASSFSPVSWRAGLPIVLALAAYFITRLSISSLKNTHTGHTALATLGIFMSAYNEAPPIRLVDSFAGLWLMPLLFILCLQTRGARPWGPWIYLAFMGLAIGPAFLVLDFERSLCYLLPGVMLAVCLLPFEKAEKRGLLGMVLAFSLLWSVPGSTLAHLPEKVGSFLHHQAP